MLSGVLDEEPPVSRLRVARLDVALFRFFRFRPRLFVVADGLKVQFNTRPIVLSKVLLSEPRPPFFSFLILPPLRGSNYVTVLVSYLRRIHETKAALLEAAGVSAPLVEIVDKRHCAGGDR